MPKILLVFTGCVLTLLFANCYVNCDKLKIHKNLVQCYRGNNTEPWFGNTLEILLELIRKIEDANPTSLDIRTLSVQIVHRLRIDGIQKAQNGRETATVTPYSPSGLMVPKFELLLKLISDGPSNFDFEDSLTPAELCLFHRLVSSSVEPSIRGDEPKTCTLGDDKAEFPNYWIPTQKILNLGSGKLFILSEKYSQCPVENGVIHTSNYGSLAPGIVIASIAAALQPQSVQLRELLPTLQNKNDNDYSSLETMQKRDLPKARKLADSVKTIDNVFAANLAGDLAEACVNQVPYTGTNITIGVNGFWNKEEHPTVRYITDNIYLNWAMTDSEILGGLDGLHLANKIYSWTKKVARMKLSQVLEMYYTSRGVPTYAIENENGNRPPYDSDDDYQPSLGGIRRYRSAKTSMRMGYDEHFEHELYVDKACERKFVLARINKAKLREQTYSVAQVLQYMDTGVTLDDDLLKSACFAAVDKFYERANNLVGSLPTCEFISGNYKKPYVDLTLIIDESRNKSENLALIWYLSELIDVSSFGSYISVIHGTSGQYLVKPTNSIARAFEELRNYSGPYPSTLSLSTSLSSIIFAAEEQKPVAYESGKIVGPPQVVLVVSQGQKIGQNDFEDSRRLLEGSFQRFPNMNFLFLTDDGKTFKDLIQNVLQKPYNPIEKYQILETTNKDPTRFSTDVTRLLNSVPKWLTIPREEQSPDGTTSIQHEYEDYLSPNVPVFYKIHEKELEGRGDFAVQFVGVGYGDFTVCILNDNDNKNLRCQSTTVQDPVWFNITNSCDLTKSNTCSPITFKLEMDSSNMKCSESDCRYPDQVRFIIRPTKWSKNSSTKISLSNMLLSSLILLFSVKLMNS